MKTTKRFLVFIMLMLCCFGMEAYNRGNRLVSSDMSIQGDIRKQRNGNGISVSMSGADASITRSGGMGMASGSKGLRVGQSSYGSGFGAGPISLAMTTGNADGEGPGEIDPQGFGEPPKSDITPVGDAIVPMLLLLGLYVAVKRFRRVP